MRNKYGRSKPLKAGFTIVELLIVLVISSLLMGLASVRFREFSRRQAVGIAKRELVGDIRAAQSDSLNGRKPAGCGTLVSINFHVRGTSGPPRYEIYAVCSTPNANLMIKQATLESDIVITMPSVNPIQFRPVTQGTNIGNTTTINISHTGSSITDSVVISSLGEVR